jgi:Flp pilus assembly protein TadG
MNGIPLMRRQQGLAAVEMAILLIPLVIMTFGMTELGRALYYYNTLAKGTRDAARFLSMHARGDAEPEARCLAVYGRTTCTASDTDSLAPNARVGMVSISYEPAVETGYGSIDLVKVTVSDYPFSSLVPMVVTSMVFGPIATTMRQAGS